MPEPAYLEIAEAPGSVTIAGREATMEVLAVEHKVHLPVDPHSGRSTGVRVHSPFRVTCAFDAATPLMYKAVTEGLAYPEVKCHFFRIDDTGTEVEYYTIVLTNARVSSVETLMHNAKDKTKEHYNPLVTYNFVYQSITWTFTDGAIEHTDDWLAAR